MVAAETAVSAARRQSRAGEVATPSDSRAPSPTLSPAESTSSLAGPGPPEVGDRVIVASSMAGTKTGTLRYLGPTDFAKG